MTPPEGQTFYIGDNPVTLHNDEPRTLHSGQLGIGARYIQVYLPLAASVMVAIVTGSVVGFAFLSHLSTWFVQETALDGVRREADLFEGTNEYYSEHVLNRLENIAWDTGAPELNADGKKILITHKYAQMKDALPYPKTFTKDAGALVSANVPGFASVCRVLHSQAVFEASHSHV